MISRRRVLASGLIGTAALCSRPLFGSEQLGAGRLDAERLSPRRIALKNLHTGETLDLEYFRDDAYLPDAMAAIETVLRDFRTGDRHAIDANLLDYLVETAARVGRPAEFRVISGYRSPETNERLHERSSGVSQHSLHMQGRAIDVRMIGVESKDLAAGAESLRLGGVGYYRGSDFVHLDTGAFRTWKG